MRAVVGLNSFLDPFAGRAADEASGWRNGCVLACG